MSTFPGSPRLLKGGIVLIDPVSSRVKRVIALQYNPDTLTRTLTVNSASTDGGDRAEALRLKGPPTELIKLDAEIDATDQLEQPDQNRTTATLGIYPQLAALETIVYPTSSQLQSNHTMSSFGTLEIVPMETDLMLFVWSASRIVPVRLVDFAIVEEAFDAALNPIRARVSLGMRVLSVSDIGFSHKGGSLFMSYLQQKERLASLAAGPALSTFGITGIP